MTQDEIIEMAHEAGLHIATDVNWMPVIGLEYAEKFAKLVVERDRANILAVIGDNQCECRCSEVVRDGGLL